MTTLHLFENRTLILEVVSFFSGGFAIIESPFLQPDCWMITERFPTEKEAVYQWNLIVDNLKMEDLL